MPSTTSKNKPKHSIQFDAIGTSWTIETDREISHALKSEIDECIEKFDAVYSRFRDDSVVAEMAKSAGTFTLPNGSEMAKLYRQLYDATAGAVTPLVGGGLVAAGYDKDYSLHPTAPLPSLPWDGTIEWSGESITTTAPIVFDVGAAGKGLLVDLVAEILETAGYKNYVIDASGDIRQRGGDVQVIGLENPMDTSRVIGTVDLQNTSLCASASNRRRWAGDWHHILDGRTGQPANDIIASWVIAKSTMVADGIATALFFVGEDELSKVADFQSVRLNANGKIKHSKNFVGQLYI